MLVLGLALLFVVAIALPIIIRQYDVEIKGRK